MNFPGNMFVAEEYSLWKSSRRSKSLLLSHSMWMAEAEIRCDPVGFPANTVLE